MQCEAAWTPAWAKSGAVARTQVSQDNINAARASVAAICGYNASATYVSGAPRPRRDHGHGGRRPPVRITVGLSKKLGAGETVTVQLTASGVSQRGLRDRAAHRRRHQHRRGAQHFEPVQRGPAGGGVHGPRRRRWCGSHRLT